MRQIYPDIAQGNLEYLRVGEGNMSVDGSERLVTPANGALVARIDRTKNSVKLTLADYWEFGDLEIGDGKNGVTKPYREWYSRYDQYKQAKTSAAVNPLNLQQPADGPNLPKWPSMTFNTFTSNDNFQRPSEDVENNVVVRWVNRLDVVGSDKLKFQDNAPFTYESGDTYETTMACLLTHLKEYTSRLFPETIQRQVGAGALGYVAEG